MAAGKYSDKTYKDSYLQLRRTIGILAVALPVIVVLGVWILTPSLELQGSISAYYHTQMRNWFVGTLVAIGVFLLSYDPGSYDTTYQASRDRQYGNYAGLFAIIVALFPTWREGWGSILPPAIYNEELFGFLHLIFAVLLFLMLFHFSYNLFTKTSQKGKLDPKSKKALRNKIYRASGRVILACIALMGLNYYFVEVFGGQLPQFFETFPPLFLLEWIALWAFGVAWFIKGEALAYFND